MADSAGKFGDDHAVSGDASGPELTRRGFFSKGAATVAGGAALAAALSPLRDMEGGDVPSVEEFFQKHYKEMTPEELRAVLDRIERQVEQRYEVDAKVQDVKPLDGVEFV